MLKKLSILALVVLIIAALVYSFAYYFVIPKTAMLLLPVKWKVVGPGQKRDNYLMYLGSVSTTYHSSDKIEDEWIVKKANYSFCLNIRYNADTVGEFARIQYRFRNALFDKSERINIGSP